MKLRNITYTICLLLLIWNCSGEDEDVKATENMPDWLEVKDQPGEFNQLCYTIYKDNQLTLLINDTLGVIHLRDDAYGNPLYHTEIFDIKYNIYGTVDLVDRKLPTMSESMLLAAKTIKQYVLPNLPEVQEYRPRAILLTDSVTESKRFTQSGRPYYIEVDLYSYNNSIRGVVAGMLHRLTEMTEVELKFWAGHIAAGKSSAWIVDNCAEILTDFYAITGSFYNKPYAYSTSATSVYNKNIQKEYGFLRWFADNQQTDRRRLTLTQIEDVIDYMAAVYVFRDDLEAFKAYFGDYEKTTQKYEMMRDMVDRMEKKIKIK